MNCNGHPCTFPAPVEPVVKAPVVAAEPAAKPVESNHVNDKAAVDLSSSTSSLTSSDTLPVKENDVTATNNTAAGNC